MPQLHPVKKKKEEESYLLPRYSLQVTDHKACDGLRVISIYDNDASIHNSTQAKEMTVHTLLV